MNCPRCKKIYQSIVDTQHISFDAKRRRIECLECGYRWTTIEIIIPDGRTPLRVNRFLRQVLPIMDAAMDRQ